MKQTPCKHRPPSYQQVWVGILSTSAEMIPLGLFPLYFVYSQPVSEIDRETLPMYQM